MSHYTADYSGESDSFATASDLADFVRRQIEDDVANERYGELRAPDGTPVGLEVTVRVQTGADDNPAVLTPEDEG